MRSAGWMVAVLALTACGRGAEPDNMAVTTGPAISSSAPSPEASDALPQPPANPLRGPVTLLQGHWTTADTRFACLGVQALEFAGDTMTIHRQGDETVSGPMVTKQTANGWDISQRTADGTVFGFGEATFSDAGHLFVTLAYRRDAPTCPYVKR